MNDTKSSERPPASDKEMQSALFANLILQHSSMAMIFLGQAPNPESGQTTVDLEGAKLFIDTLEMLEAKTKGNLDRDEERMLSQTLYRLRMAFVEAVNRPAAAPSEAAKPAPSDANAADHAPAAASASADAATPASASAPAPPPAEDSESKKKFTKKY